MTAFKVAASLLLLTASAHAALQQRPAGECLDPSYKGAAQTLFPSGFQVLGSPALTVQAAGSTTISFAQGFNVTYYPTYKLVTNLLSQPPKMYALYPCGMDPPAPSSLPVNTTIFQIPLTSLSVEDTTVLSFLNQLGLLGRISYITEYAVNPCMQSLGKYGCKRLTSGNVDINDVDGIFGWQNSIKTIAVSASSDPGPLNRAEWIKFVATFFNKEDVANAVFDAITRRYNSLKVSVLAQNVASKPVVAWVIYMPAYDPDPAQIQISFAPYKAILTLDAGGRMLDLDKAKAAALKYSSNDADVQEKYGSLVLRLASPNITKMLREVLADVDIMIDETQYPDISNRDLTLNDVLKTYTFTAQDQQTLKFIKNNKIIRVDATSNPDSYTSWFEQGVAQPDVVLRDLATIITPAAVTTNTPLQFLRVLGQQPSVLLSAASCPLQNCLVSSAQGVGNDPICPLVYRACDGSIVPATVTQRCAPVCTPATTPAATPAAATLAAPLVATLSVATLLALVLSLLA